MWLSFTWGFGFHHCLMKDLSSWASLKPALLHLTMQVAGVACNERCGGGGEATTYAESL